MGNATKIAELNDQVRKEPARYGRAYITDGVAARGPEFVHRALAATAAFEAFTVDNDPYGEHDFGTIRLDGETLFWKIDYHDKANPDCGAENPSDPVTTARVLTIMRADEY